MNIFIAANRTHLRTDWTAFWLFCTRTFGIPATACIVVAVATAMVAFAIYLKGFPQGMKTSVKIAVGAGAEILTVALALAGYWMTLYSYGII
ncbi:MAG: hypothetical protein IKF17_02225 [Clostridia bacterium]|nr:hypothetical protein [Clostridia bacterium]